MVTLRRPPTGPRRGPVLEPYQVILRPLITEKATHLSERHNAYTFEVNILATKTEIKEAIESPVQRQGRRRPDPESPRQAPPLPPEDRLHAAMEEGHRHAVRRLSDRLLLSSQLRVPGVRWLAGCGIHHGDGLTATVPDPTTALSP